MEDNLEQGLKEKIKEIAVQEGVELVDFKLGFYGGRYSLRCLVDYREGGITIDKCTALNKKIFEFLEAANLLGEDFTLEVNSPGLDYPLKDYKDFLRIKGNIVGIWLNYPVDEKTYLEGMIVDVNEQGIALKTKDKTHNIELGKIKIGKARLDL